MIVCCPLCPATYLDDGENDLVVDLLGGRIDVVGSIEAEHLRWRRLVAGTDQRALTTGRVDVDDDLPDRKVTVIISTYRLEGGGCVLAPASPINCRLRLIAYLAIEVFLPLVQRSASRDDFDSFGGHRGSGDRWRQVSDQVVLILALDPGPGWMITSRPSHTGNPSLSSWQMSCV